MEPFIESEQERDLDWEARSDNRKKALEEIQPVLAAHGIRLVVGGCGCCDSPWLTVEVDGQMLLDAGNANINMLKEDE
jgi:hypothetical protein